MSSKFVFLLLGLLALGTVIESKSLLKKFVQKEKIHFEQKHFEPLRVRRDVIDESDEITSEEAMTLMKFFMTAGWEEHKLDLLASFLESMADSDSNVTVVGWHRITDENGQVKQIDTVQLVIPPKPETEDDKKEDNDDDDDDDDEDEDEDSFLPYGQINELRTILEPLAEVGIPASATMEAYKKSGEEEVFIYIDKDELYVSSDGYVIYNKTAVASAEEVEAFIKSQKPTILGAPSVLKFDVDGKLISDQSTISASHLGYVSDYYEAPDDVLLKSPEIIAKVSQTYGPEHRAEHLVKEYDTAFPTYKWRVLVDPAHYYITRDVTVTVGYDNLDLDEYSDISYMVYGVKK